MFVTPRRPLMPLGQNTKSAAAPAMLTQPEGTISPYPRPSVGWPPKATDSKSVPSGSLPKDSKAVHTRSSASLDVSDGNRSTATEAARERRRIA